MKNLISDKHLNGLFTEETFFHVKNIISDTFRNAKFVFTVNKIENLNSLDRRLEIINEIHERAHRNYVNNYNEAQRVYFWPKMKNDFRKKGKSCVICKTQKYERVPAKQPIGTTPIPTGIGESISMDLFHIDNRVYVTSIDRYSKYYSM